MDSKLNYLHLLYQALVIGITHLLTFHIFGVEGHENEKFSLNKISENSLSLNRVLIKDFVNQSKFQTKIITPTQRRRWKT